MDINTLLPLLLALAWLLPLASFVLIVLFGPRMGKAGYYAAYVATAAIVAGFVLSVAALGVVAVASSARPPATASHAAGPPPAISRRLVRAGQLRRAADHDRLLHRLADAGHVLHGHAGGLVHPRLFVRLHARRAVRGVRRAGPAGRRPAGAAPRPVLPLLPVPLAVLLQHVGAGDRRQRGDGVRVLGTGGHLLLSADRLLVRAQERVATRPTRRSSSTAWAISA